MLHITIIAVDTVKKDFFKDAAAEYLKRLKPFGRVKVEELPRSPFGSESQHRQAKRHEGDAILARLKKYPDAFSIALTESGVCYTSPTLAEFLQRHEHRHLLFIIGGALGLDERVIQMSQTSLSLSELTFPHELARVILYEQLYRAATIMTGKPYHY